MKNKLLLIILFLALAVRLAYFFVFDPPLNWGYCETFHITSQNIILGQGYSLDGATPFISREPGYSAFFLAPLYAIFGPTVFGALLLNVLLTLLIIILIYRLGQCLAEKIGLLAGLFFALYPPLIAFSGELVPATAFTFLLLLSVYLIVQAVERKTGWRALLAGLFLGAAVLTKSIALFLPIFLTPFLYLGLNKKCRPTVKYFILICLGIVIMIAPYTIRNYLAFDQFIFGRDDAGLNLFVGSYLPWDGEFRGNNVFPLPEMFKEFGPGFEADKKFKDIAIENIKENPLKVLGIWLKKPSRMFFKPEFKSVLERENQFSNLSNRGALNPDFIKLALLIINIILIGMAFFGALNISKNCPVVGSLLVLVIVYFLVLLLPFSPDVRYKLPLMPYLMILASLGFSILWKQLRKVGQVKK